MNSTQIETKQLPYLGLLVVLFSHWDADAFTRTVAHAKRMIEIHGGDIRRAHDGACELAYGNVSLAARRSMAPTAEVLGAMLKGFA